MIKQFLFFIIFLLASVSVLAKGQYMSTEQFIQHAFNGEAAKMKVLWLNKEDKATVADIMKHPVNMFRVRYWQHQEQTAWVLNEIGKEKPITIWCSYQRQSNPVT